MSQFVTPTSHKSRRTALILCLIGGLFGLHRFGFFFIGAIIDFIHILRGTFKDKNGMPLIEW